MNFITVISGFTPAINTSEAAPCPWLLLFKQAFTRSWRWDNFHDELITQCFFYNFYIRPQWAKRHYYINILKHIFLFTHIYHVCIGAHLHIWKSCNLPQTLMNQVAYPCIIYIKWIWYLDKTVIIILLQNEVNTCVSCQM